MDRMSWEDYFFGMAKMVSQRATCPSRKVGAVIVDPETKAIITTGYNGAARGTPHCGDACNRRKSGDSYEKCKAIHAELNAIIAAALNGVSTMGMEMYLTTTPCVFCARLIINSGIERVYALSYYPAPDALELLAIGGVDVVVVQSDTVPSIMLKETS
jgi:dCMP deaminase